MFLGFRPLMLAMILCAGVLDAAPAHARRSVLELVRKADLVARSKTSAAVFEMQIKARSYQRKLKVVFWDDQRDAEREKTLLKILGPALWRGYGTLKLGSQLKLYNPRNNHVTVVGQSLLGDAWMGSHFTNDDLVKETRLARHYRSKLLKTWTAKGGAADATHYRIALYPKPNAPVSWGRIDYVLWERGDVVMPVKASYFRKAADERPRREMSFSAVKKLGGRLMPAIMTVTMPKKPGEYTKLIYRKVKFDVKIPSSKFTEQALRR